MSRHRSDPVQQGPPSGDDLDGFPALRAVTGSWFREHGERPQSPDVGCWWFTCRRPRTGGDDEVQVGGVGRPEGRFDLFTPHGTCYLGETSGVAVRERCGRFLAANMPIPEGHLEGRVVSTVTAPPLPRPAADLTSPEAAAFGVTGELASGNDYALSADWAQALFEAGHQAVLYHPRFTPGGERALGLFSDAGADPERGVIATRPLAEAVAELGYRVSRSQIPSAAAAAVEDDAEVEDA